MAALIADVYTDRWDLMVGVATGERRENEDENEEMKKGKKADWKHEDWGMLGWMDRRMEG